MGWRAPDDGANGDAVDRSRQYRHELGNHLFSGYRDCGYGRDSVGDLMFEGVQRALAVAMNVQRAVDGPRGNAHDKQQEKRDARFDEGVPKSQGTSDGSAQRE